MQYHSNTLVYRANLLEDCVSLQSKLRPLSPVAPVRLGPIGCDLVWALWGCQGDQPSQCAPRPRAGRMPSSNASRRAPGRCRPTRRPGLRQQPGKPPPHAIDCCSFCAPVAQLDRALASGARGQRFESSRARQFLFRMLARLKPAAMSNRSQDAGEIRVDAADSSDSRPGAASAAAIYAPVGGSHIPFSSISDCRPSSDGRRAEGSRVRRQLFLFGLD